MSAKARGITNSWFKNYLTDALTTGKSISDAILPTTTKMKNTYKKQFIVSKTGIIDG
jgi:hypothetical protein